MQHNQSFRGPSAPLIQVRCSYAFITRYIEGDRGGQSLMRRTIGLCFIAFLLNGGNQLWAQDQATGDILAQKLVDGLLAKRQPELLYVGLHLVPPSETDMTVIAATLRAKIGEKSSCADLHAFREFPFLMKGGGTTIKGTTIGSTMLAPLHDRNGNTIGVVAMGLKFTTGEESEAARFARRIEQELSGEIPSRTALFARVQ
jgi:hypothetical protein